LDSDNAANRLVLAEVNFKPENSYAARETWLWKFITPQASMESIIRTGDDQFDYRASLASDPVDKINAVGRPNRDGAKEYARAVESAIESEGSDWLQNKSALRQDVNTTRGSSQAISSTASSQSIYQPQITWRKNFVDYMYYPSIQQTSDGGYIIAGYSGSNVRLIKTDPKGDTVWDNELKAPKPSSPCTEHWHDWT